LAPPDGLFLVEMKKALTTIANNAMTSLKPVVIRMMFGNIVGRPVNCDAVLRALTEDLPDDANIQLWVGAWRKGVSWNHAKIISVDGRYLHTGGHNMWDAHCKFLSFVSLLTS
jgi:phosphatidylserine/phosphatidylglycerophosphate/cardiolipin synthase-like enzyme